MILIRSVIFWKLFQGISAGDVAGKAVTVTTVAAGLTVGAGFITTGIGAPVGVAIVVGISVLVGLAADWIKDECIGKK